MSTHYFRSVLVGLVLSLMAGCSDSGPGENLCGNGMLDGQEACDDNNTDDGDGCSSACVVEPGYECSGSPSVCIFYCIQDSDCDDDDPCTDDVCNVGIGCSHLNICGCESDEECDDGNPCTDDTCNNSDFCEYSDNSASCDDLLFCNGADSCSEGNCSVHAGDPCTSGGECDDTCNETNDTCNLPDGTPCTDDGDVCTDDVCDGSGTCGHPNNSAPCDDGIFCNGTDTCSGGECRHSGDPCASGGECADSCDEIDGDCFADEGLPCSDDGNPCTDDVCGSSGTCDAIANTATCDDGLYCNGADTCADGVCEHTGDPCAGEYCDEGGDTCLSSDPPFVRVSAGSSHACGLTAVGVIYCWGSDSGGRLGNGPLLTEEQHSPVPIDVSTVTGDTEFVQVSAGGTHSCALTVEGVAYCWGQDYWGELGNGDATADDQESPSPVDISGITGNPAFAQIFAGNEESCGITVEGKAYCWGRDTRGQLGNDDAFESKPSPVPVDDSVITGNKAFVQVAPGLHTCGLTVEGVVYCWGSDFYGTLGNGSTLTDDMGTPYPIDVTGITGNTTFIQLAGGLRHICALTAEGVAYCWGRDSEMQLGNGDTLTTNQDIPSLVDVSGITGNPAFVKLTGGHDHACGIAADGVAYCWGSDAWGQLGNGDLVTDDQSTPSPLDTLGMGNGAFVDISAGGVFTCGLTADGVTHCWGRDDTAGQLGNGPGITANQPSPFRVDVSSILTPRTFTKLSAAGDVTCGVTTGGGAYCWGFDGMGQLGNGAELTESQNTPSAIVTANITGNPVFAGVEASAYHTCGVTAEGVPYCWGQDSSAQLGNGDVLTDDQPEPSPVTTSGISQNQAFVQVVTGYSHSCGLAADGRAYCWGADTNGQLGNGATTGTQDTPSAVETSGLSNPAFIRLTAGISHTCGLTADRTAYCWGSNSSGQLGGAGSGVSPVPVTTSGISGNPIFVKLRACGDHTCGLTADGVAYCWGSDSYQSLGNGSAGSTTTPTPVDTTVITGDTTFVDLAPGRYHGCGRTADGITHCWGWDQWGQVGNGGITGDQPSPTPIDPSGISGSTVLLRLASGTAHSCAIAGDGVAHCWGRGTAGQLGNGSFAGTLEPGPVVAIVP